MCESIGDVAAAREKETLIAWYEAICIQKFGAQEAFGKSETKEQVLERFRTSYQLEIEKYGEVSSLATGLGLATLLRQSHHTIEAWRLFKRLIVASKQHHGPEHWLTKKLNVHC
jgi:hypothetical protein